MSSAKRPPANRMRLCVLSIVCAWGLLGATASHGYGQQAGRPRDPSTATGEQVGQAQGDSEDEQTDLRQMENRLSGWEGKPVLRVEFAGVGAVRLEPLPGELPQQAHHPLRGQDVAQSLRRLYLTGLYDAIAVDGRLETVAGETGVVLTFRGAARTFIGVVTVEGAKGANTNSLLVRTSRLTRERALRRRASRRPRRRCGGRWRRTVFTNRS